MPNQVTIANNQYIYEPNKHIEEYLNYYCELPHSPKFAILLKGKWGAGKTWFINQYIEKLKANKKKCLYVSLYGVTNYSEIEDLLRQQLYPFRTSKGMVIAGKLFTGLLKGALKIDLNNDGKDDGSWNFSIPDINIPQKFEDSSFSLLIFDDLERCSINIENILGYINSFVESQYLKVVIIANEEEISTEKEKYKKIKEKLIGKTFEISPDFSGALNEVLNQVHNPQAKDFLSKNLDFIQDLYKQAECMNLRILNQISLDFVRFFEKLPENARNKAELIKDLLELLIIFSIEISSGRLEPKDISQIDKKLEVELVESAGAMRAKDTDSKENKANTEDKKSLIGIFHKYQNIYDKVIYSSESLPFSTAFPNLSVWGDFFDKGIIDKEALEKSTSKYFKDETSPYWIKLWQYQQLSDDDFEKLIELVNLEYQKRDYDDINIIKHITGLFLNFSEVGLYPKTKEDILDDAKLYIDYLRNNNKLNLHFPEDLPLAYGFAFQSKESLEFKKFCEYIKQSKNQAKINKAPEAARNLLRIMQTDTDKFSSMIRNNLNYTIKMLFNENYLDFPIFNYMSPDEFVKTILKLENTERNYVFYSLKQRYASQNHDLNQEINFLIEVKKILLKEVDQRQGKLMGYLLNQANQIYLEPIIVGLKQNKA